MVELLEREAELQELAAAWRDAITGQGRIALVSGEAGIGKTSLVGRFTREQNAARTLWGACDALFTPRPLGPLHDMAAHLRGNLPELLRTDANRAVIFSALLAELQSRPTLAVFEDVHWADEATLDLLKFVGRRVERTSALVVLTYRDDELDSRHPLRTVLGDLATSPALRRIALAPLSEKAVQTLVGVQPIDAAELHRQTGGNPFFVTEVLDGAVQGIPVTVRDAVLARVARLSASAQALLQAAAVLGPRIEPWALTAVTGADANATEECLALGMLVAQGEVLTFRHELARQTVLDTLSPPRKLRLHQLALETLQNSPHTRADLTRLAHHAEAAGDHRAVLEYAPAAAHQAALADAHREAAALYHLTLRFATQVPLGDRAQWLDKYAVELHTLGALEESVAVRQEAVMAWRALGERHREGVNLARMAVTLLNVGRPAEAQQASQHALDLLQSLPPSAELAAAERTQAHLLMLNRDCAEAVVWGQRAIALAQHFNDAGVLARAYTTVGAALLLQEDERGYEYLTQCLALAREIGWEFGIANAYANLGMAFCETHRFRAARVHLKDGRAYTSERDLDFLGKYMLAWQALTALYLGEWEAALTQAHDALHGLGVTAITRIPALIALGRTHARRGEADPWASLDEALAWASDSQTVQRVGLVRAARAEAAWLMGDLQRTRDEAQAMYDLAVSKQHRWLAGELAFWRWRAGEMIPVSDGMARPFALQMNGNWQAAALDWEQRGCPYEQARALADGDASAQMTALEMFDQLGARPAAEALRQTMRTAGVTSIPRGPRPTTRAHPFGLTQRQTEILGLLVQDLTNTEIAARLHLSPKTVDRHVSAVLAKLDVHSREAAADLARQHTLPTTTK